MRTNEQPPPSSPASAGALLGLIRDDVAVTRADLARATGLARSTVAQRVEALLRQDLVYEAGGSTSTGGRPPTVLAFNHQAGVVLVADLGATHARVAVSDLRARRWPSGPPTWTSRSGPEKVLKWVSDRFTELLEEVGRPATDVRGIGIGVPGPGRVRRRAAGEPADHARLGRLRHPRLVRGPVRARRCWWTTT